jgi:hypothetical protein
VQWAEGKGSFGDIPNLQSTIWTTSDIWLRRHFNPGNLTEEEIANVVANDSHEGNIEIYINGVLAYAQGGQSDAWEYRGLTTAARASIRPNADNVLAVHCARNKERNTQFVDAGLALRILSAQ